MVAAARSGTSTVGSAAASVAAWCARNEWVEAARRLSDGPVGARRVHGVHSRAREGRGKHVADAVVRGVRAVVARCMLGCATHIAVAACCGGRWRPAPRACAAEAGAPGRAAATGGRGRAAAGGGAVVTTCAAVGRARRHGAWDAAEMSLGWVAVAVMPKACVVCVKWGWMLWAKARRRRLRTSLSLLGASIGATILLHEVSGCKPGPASGRATAAPSASFPPWRRCL